MESQQIEQHRALLGLLGHTYGQLKEIDTHIAAAGSNAKFAGRSDSLKRQFETLATTPFAVQPNNDSELELPPVQSPVFTQPQAVQVQPIQHAAPAAALQDDSQLEFNFKQAEKNVLQDIYNILYDIKKIMLDNKKTQPAPKKKISDCILCGSKATISLATNAFEVKCSNCNACTTQEHASAKNAVKEWNKDNQ